LFGRNRHLHATVEDSEFIVRHFQMKR
jgi:hypothetical protein